MNLIYRLSVRILRGTCSASYYKAIIGSVESIWFISHERLSNKTLVVYKDYTRTSRSSHNFLDIKILESLQNLVT